MSLLTGGLHHLTIRTTDLARAKRFYVDTLGFEVVRERDGALILNAHGTTFGVLGAAVASGCSTMARKHEANRIP